jgi:hypothetical protein
MNKEQYNKTIEFAEANGYVKKKNSFSGHTGFAWFKMIEDELGKKYQIGLIPYEFTRFDAGYDIEAEAYFSGEHYFRISASLKEYDYSLIKVEELFETIFEATGRVYYEK